MDRAAHEMAVVESESFAELFPAVYAHFCRRWSPGEYRPMTPVNVVPAAPSE